jgi:hypothetical protein
MRKSALPIAIGASFGLMGICIVMVLVSIEIPAWVGIPIMACAGVLVSYWIWIDHRDRAARRARAFADGFSDGDSVEVDCRLCGQFNRVPAARLRDRPICGRCKTRLMPGKRVVLCRTSRIDGPLSANLDELWSDEDRLWGCLADHLVLKRPANPANPTDGDPRQIVVN